MSFPPIAELLPHAGPMRLLASVLRHDAFETECGLDVAASALFAGAEGRLPSYVALEWMAQAIAAHGGLAARAAGRAPAPGLLVGARRVALARTHFAPGQRLTVLARFAGAAGALASFECEVREGRERVAQGVLSVFVSEQFHVSRAVSASAE